MSEAATDKVDAISEAGDTIVITRGRNYVAIYYCWWFVEESEINKDDGEVVFYATVAPSKKSADFFPLCVRTPYFQHHLQRRWRPQFQFGKRSSYPIW